MIKIREMTEADIAAVAQVHGATFPRQFLSLEWITCNLKAYPRIQYYVAELNGEVLGFVEWLQKSGFRKEAVLELEQIAVLPGHQGKGIGGLLIKESLLLVKQQLETRTATIKHLVVTTRTDNAAQRLYASTLNAEVELIIRDLYSADEVMMIARNVGKRLEEKEVAES